MADENKKVQTAFIVVVEEDGSVQATSDLTQEFDCEHEATFGDMRRAASEIVHDINAMQAANNIMQILTQQAQAAAEAQANAKIVEKLKGKGIHVASK